MVVGFFVLNHIGHIEIIDFYVAHVLYVVL